MCELYMPEYFISCEFSFGETQQ